jgi:hypothetical protein
MDDFCGKEMTQSPVPMKFARRENPTPRRRGTWGIATLLAVLLLLSFALQLPGPRVADWKLFAFYDPGTVLKGDWLLSKGYVPTVDFGYTHGLVALLYGRIGFALLGRTPAAFFILTLLAETVMSWALARLVAALQLKLPSVLLLIAALPMAIMPAYLTLAHPLEAMLILLALADQAEGKRPRALALLTVCLFVKPSMAYVYGFVLVILIITRGGMRARGTVRAFFPAAVVFVMLFAALAARFGIAPVIHTLLPITGAKTYAATDFGFFAPQGRAFWITGVQGYFLSPVGVFLLGAIVAAGGALWALVRFAKARPRRAAVPVALKMELILTIGILHTAFLLGFYGWTGSWTYYSYLPILALVLVLDAVGISPRIRWIAAGILIGLVLLSHVELVATNTGAWTQKVRTPSGLWGYRAQLDEWKRMVDATQTPRTRVAGHGGGKGGHRTLVMTNGWIPDLPANCELPDAWFPEPGIPTASEIARVKKQADGAEYVILWREYGSLDLWNSAAFAGERKGFEPVVGGEWLTLLRRTAGER